MPPDAFGDAMNETLSPQSAARLLTDAASFEGALQQRTEGITSMVWGAVGPGIYLSYGYAERAEGFPDWGWAVLWIPWILASTLITFALWRSAALTAPKLDDPITPLGYLWRFALITLCVSVVFAFWDPDHYGAPLLVIGAMYLVLGGLNPYGMSRRGRAVALVSGAGFLLVATVALSQPETGLGFTLTVLVSGFVPIVAGFWQTMTS